MPCVGARVVVPLGTRIVTGIVVDVAAASRNAQSRSPIERGTSDQERKAIDADRRMADVKVIRELLDPGPFVPPEVVALAQWTAEYYASGVGDTIPALLPPMARGGRADAHKTTRVAAITAAGIEALAAEGGLTAKQREALAILAGIPTGIATPALAARGIAADAISRLARHGYISLRQDRVDRDPFTSSELEVGVSSRGLNPEMKLRLPARQLTGEQADALSRLTALADARAFKV